MTREELFLEAKSKGYKITHTVFSFKLIEIKGPDMTNSQRFIDCDTFREALDFAWLLDYDVYIERNIVIEGKTYCIREFLWEKDSRVKENYTGEIFIETNNSYLLSDFKQIVKEYLENRIKMESI